MKARAFNSIIGGVLAAFFAAKFRRKTIGKYYTHEDVIKSAIAAENGLMQFQRNIDGGKLLNAERLAVFVLDPAIDFLNGRKFQINSWYRSPELNAHPQINGAANSVHKEARAADIKLIIDGQRRNDLAMRAILQRSNFDRILLEFGTIQNPQWIQVEVAPFAASPRRQILYTPDGQNFQFIPLIDALQIFG